MLVYNFVYSTSAKKEAPAPWSRATNILGRQLEAVSGFNWRPNK